MVVGKGGGGGEKKSLCCQLLNAHCKGNKRWIPPGQAGTRAPPLQNKHPNQPGHQPGERIHQPVSGTKAVVDQHTCIETLRGATEFTPPPPPPRAESLLLHQTSSALRTCAHFFVILDIAMCIDLRLGRGLTAIGRAGGGGGDGKKPGAHLRGLSSLHYTLSEK